MSPSAFVFDAYGTLLDVDALAVAAEREAPGHGPALASLWRRKQLEYSWLASLMGRAPTFAQVTAEALDYAIAVLGLPLDAAVHARLAAEWLALPAYPDAAPVLRALAPRPCWILSNGDPAMLAPALTASGLARHLAGVVSVADVGVFKPSARVYAHAADRLGLTPADIGFVSANGWDVAGAKAFGLATYWVNRTGAPVERHAEPPDHVLDDLQALPGLVGR